MSLKLKIFLLLLLFLGIYSVMETGIHRFVVLPQFLALEAEEAKKGIQRCRAAIELETARINAVADEWATREGIYQCIKNGNNEYIDSRFDGSFFENRNLNFLYLFNESKELLWSRTSEVAPNEKEAFDKILYAFLSAAETSLSGLAITGSGPVLAACKTISSKDIEGNIRGFLIVGRFIDEHLMAAMISQTEFAFQVWPIKDGQIEGMDQNVLQHISPERPIFIDDRDDNNLAVYGTLWDVNGTDSLLIRADIPRKIRSTGISAIQKVLVCLLTGGSILTLMLWRLFRQILVHPINKLTGHAQYITTTSDLSARLNMPSSDEIGILANTFDRMMDRVEEKTTEEEEINRELENEINERKKTQSALEKSEERYRLLAENATDVIWTTDLDYHVTYVSPSITQLRGYSVEEVMNQRLEEALTPSSLKVMNNLNERLEQERDSITSEEWSKPVTIDLEYYCKDGSTVWVETKSRYLFGEDGKPMGYLGIGRDITGRRKSEQALRESEEKFRMISEQSLLGIVILQDGHVVYVNEKAAQISGYSCEEILSWGPDEFLKTVHPDYLKDLFEAKTGPIDMSRGDETFHFIYRIITKEEKMPWIEQYSRMIKYKGRDAILNIMIDITDRKQQEEEIKKYQEHLEVLVDERAAELKLEIINRKRAHEEVNRLNKELEERVKERTAELDKACEELKELDKMKDSFLSLVSHELRTPLTSIRSFSEILLQYKDEDPETREEFMTIINSESERLTRLINDVLDLSRIEAGEMLWKDEYLSMNEIIRDVLKTQHQLLSQKSISLNLDLSEDIPLVRADRDRIHQVITNLVSNAHKFSFDGGEIRVRAETITTGQSNDEIKWVKISISDKGSGINKRDYETVFDKFYQIPNTALKAKPHGTGLGLPICKEIITHYLGEIWVESGLEGKGSTISFTLPAAADGN